MSKSFLDSTDTNAAVLEAVKKVSAQVGGVHKTLEHILGNYLFHIEKMHVDIKLPDEIYESMLQVRSDIDTTTLISKSGNTEVFDGTAEDSKKENHPIEKSISEAIDCLGSGDANRAIDIMKETLSQSESLNGADEEARYLLAHTQAAYAQALMHAHMDIDFAWDLICKAVRATELKTKPEKYHGALLIKGFLAVFSGKTDEANGVVLTAQKLDLSDSHKSSLRVIQGHLLSILGKQSDAISAFQENINYCIEKLAITEDAEKIQELKEIYAECLNQLASIDICKRKYVDALQKLRKACELISDAAKGVPKAIYKLRYSECLLRNDQNEQALKELEYTEIILEEYRIDFLRIKLLEARAQALYKENRFAESKVVYEQALSLSRDEHEKMHFHRILAHFIVRDGDAEALDYHIAAARDIAAALGNGLHIHGIEEQYEKLRKFKRYTKRMLIGGRERDVIRLPKEDEVANILPMAEIRQKAKNKQEMTELMTEALREGFRKNSRDQKESIAKKSQIRKENIEGLIQLAETAENPRRKSLMFNDIGEQYMLDGNLTEAKRWKSSALDEANVADDDEARAYAMLGLAAVYFYTEEPGDDERSRRLISEVKQMLSSKPFWTLNARCLMFDGVQAARNGKFDSALALFQKALSILRERKIEDFDFVEKLRECIGFIKGRKSTFQPSEMTFDDLSRELTWLESWYPEYQRELRRYWWYYRNIDVTKNFRQSHGTKGFIAISNDAAEIEFVSRALSCLFDITMFSTRSEYKTADNFVSYSLPVPNNTPFPFSICHSFEEDGSVYLYHENSDGSTGGEYNYQMMQSDIKLDKDRTPKPIALSYHGVNLPEAVYEISPIVHENGKSGLWWIGEDFGSGLFVLTILHNAVDYGFLPVLTHEDVRDEKEVEILERKSVSLPYRTDDVSEVKKAIETIVESPNDGIRMLEHAIKQVGAVEKLDVKVDFCKLRFPYRAWIDAPPKPRVIYAILIPNSFADTCTEDIKCKILKSIAVNKAISYTRRLTAMAENIANAPYVWDGINKIDEFRVEYPDHVGLAECLIYALYNFAIVQPNSRETEKCIKMMESVYHDGYEVTPSMTSIMINVYGYACHKKIQQEDDAFKKIIDLWENGFTYNEEVSEDTAKFLSYVVFNDVKNERLSDKIESTMEKTYATFPRNGVIARIAAMYKVWQYTCKQFDIEGLISALNSMVTSSQNEPCICYLYEICTLDAVESAEALRRKLSRIDVLRKQTRDDIAMYYILIADSFFNSRLVAAAESGDIACANVIVEYMELAQKKRKKTDERFCSLYTKILCAHAELLENTAEIRKDITKIKALLENIKGNNFKNEAVYSLAKAYGALIKKQSVEEASTTLKMIEGLPAKHKIQSTSKYQIKIAEILADSIIPDNSAKTQWAIKQIERIRQRKGNTTPEFAERIIYRLGHNLSCNDWIGCTAIADYVANIANLFQENQRIAEMSAAIFKELYWNSKSDDRQKYADFLEQLFLVTLNPAIWAQWLLITFLTSQDESDERVAITAQKIHRHWRNYTKTIDDKLLPETIGFGKHNDGRIAVLYLAPMELKTSHEESILIAIKNMKDSLGERKVVLDDLVFPNPNDVQEFVTVED